MDSLSRRTFFKAAGTAAAVAGVATAASGAISALEATPAGAVGPYDGLILDEGGELFNVKSTAYGAKGDTIMATGGSISASSTSFTWTGGSFVSSDAGKVITVHGAGASGAVLSTTIATYVSATQVTLTAAASTTVSSASFAYGHDDTAAIVSALGAASPNGGTVFAPPGIYMIRGASNGNAQISLGTTGGLLGNGGKYHPGSTQPNTTFLCGDSTAGLLASACATYEGFMVNGNNIATAPLQMGTVSGSAASYSGSQSMFIDVWATASAGNGWTIYGAQNNAFYECGSTANAQDGLYIDGGSSGLSFWHFEESGSGRHGVHGDQSYSLSGSYGTSYVNFFGGTLSSVSTDTQGTSKVYLRNASNWRFDAVNIVGAHLSGSTVDLNQANGSVIDFTRSLISATSSTNCINVSGSVPGGANALVFLRTDFVNFSAGSKSVYIASSGAYLYSALGWVQDATTNGPSTGATAGIDTLLQGRTGKWQTATVTNWTAGTAGVQYRIDSSGRVQIQGNVSSSTHTSGSATIFQLGVGYRPASTTLQILASTGAPSSEAISIDTSGNVSANYPSTASTAVYLDNVSFPTT